MTFRDSQVCHGAERDKFRLFPTKTKLLVLDLARILVSLNPGNKCADRYLSEFLSGLYGRDNSFAKQPRDSVPFSTKGKTHHRYRRIVKSNALPAPLMPATEQKANLSNPVRDSNPSVLLLQVHWK